MIQISSKEDKDDDGYLEKIKEGLERYEQAD